MSKARYVAIGFIASCPIFLFAGFKWGQHTTGIEFLELGAFRSAVDTKTYTKMGVLLHDNQVDRLETFISENALGSHQAMITLYTLLGQEPDEDALKYFDENKPKLKLLAP